MIEHSARPRYEGEPDYHPPGRLVVPFLRLPLEKAIIPKPIKEFLRAACFTTRSVDRDTAKEAMSDAFGTPTRQSGAFSLGVLAVERLAKAVRAGDTEGIEYFSRVMLHLLNRLDQCRNRLVISPPDSNSEFQSLLSDSNGPSNRLAFRWLISTLHEPDVESYYTIRAPFQSRLNANSGFLVQLGLEACRAPVDTRDPWFGAISNDLNVLHSTQLTLKLLELLKSKSLSVREVARTALSNVTNDIDDGSWIAMEQKELPAIAAGRRQIDDAALTILQRCSIDRFYEIGPEAFFSIVGQLRELKSSDSALAPWAGHVYRRLAAGPCDPAFFDFAPSGHDGLLIARDYMMGDMHGAGTEVVREANLLAHTAPLGSVAYIISRSRWNTARGVLNSFWKNAARVPRHPGRRIEVEDAREHLVIASDGKNADGFGLVMERLPITGLRLVTGTTSSDNVFSSKATGKVTMVDLSEVNDEAAVEQINHLHRATHVNPLDLRLPGTSGPEFAGLLAKNRLASVRCFTHAGNPQHIDEEGFYVVFPSFGRQLVVFKFRTAFPMVLRDQLYRCGFPFLTTFKEEILVQGSMHELPWNRIHLDLLLDAAPGLVDLTLYGLSRSAAERLKSHRTILRSLTLEKSDFPRLRALGTCVWESLVAVNMEVSVSGHKVGESNDSITTFFSSKTLPKVSSCTLRLNPTLPFDVAASLGAVSVLKTVSHLAVQTEAPKALVRFFKSCAESGALGEALWIDLSKANLDKEGLRWLLLAKLMLGVTIDLPKAALETHLPEIVKNHPECYPGLAAIGRLNGPTVSRRTIIFLRQTPHLEGAELAFV